MHIPVLNLQCAFGLCEVNLPVQFCDVVMALPQVSYHYPCPDGVFAALAAHLCFSRAGQKVVWVPNAVYAPKQLGDLQLQAGQTLYMLDFAGPPGFATQAAKLGARVIILDHHKTALEVLNTTESQHPNLYAQIDMSRSGATIALDYFQPEVSQDQRRIFEYIEDADLWRWKLPNSKAFHAGLGTLKLEYDANKNPEIFQQLCQLDLEQVINQGKGALEQQAQQVAAALKSAFIVTLGGASEVHKQWGRCLAIRADSTLAQIRSSLGNALAQASASQGLRAIGVIAYLEEAMQDSTKIKVSLRSIGDEDTTAVSQAFGGGGHRNASSFVTETAVFERWSQRSDAE